MVKAIPAPTPPEELEARIKAHWKDDVPARQGRPPKGDKAMTSKERTQLHRARKRAAKVSSC
jgi:hypothetical protein